jgi:hypothetical protein
MAYQTAAMKRALQPWASNQQNWAAATLQQVVSKQVTSKQAASKQAACKQVASKQVANKQRA